MSCSTSAALSSPHPCSWFIIVLHDYVPVCGKVYNMLPMILEARVLDKSPGALLNTHTHWPRLLRLSRHYKWSFAVSYNLAAKNDQHKHCPFGLWIS